jgi:hypothetical protein
MPIIQKGGNLLAFIGVPMSLIPITAMTGFGLAVIGILPTLIDGVLNETYKWTMINKIN